MPSSPVLLRLAVEQLCNLFALVKKRSRGALRRVHIGAKKLKLDEETRWQIAGEAVEELRRE